MKMKIYLSLFSVITMLSSCSFIFHESQNMPWYFHENISFQVLDENDQIDTSAVLNLSYLSVYTIYDTQRKYCDLTYNNKLPYSTKVKRIAMQTPYLYVTVNSKGHLPKTYYFSDIREITKNTKLHLGEKSNRAFSDENEIHEAYSTFSLNESDDFSVQLNFSLGLLQDNYSVVNNYLDSLTLSVTARSSNTGEPYFEINSKNATIISLDTLNHRSWLYSDTLKNSILNESKINLKNEQNHRLIFLVVFESGVSYRCLLECKPNEFKTNYTQKDLKMNLYWVLERDQKGIDYYFAPRSLPAIYYEVIELKCVQKIK